jgi:hypothetical protein
LDGKRILKRRPLPDGRGHFYAGTPSERKGDGENKVKFGCEIWYYNTIQHIIHYTTYYMAHLILKVLYNKKEIRLKLHQTWKWGIRNET